MNTETTKKNNGIKVYLLFILDTGLNSHAKVFVRRSTTEPTKLVKYFLYNKTKPTIAMLFGLKQEKLAVQKFKTKLAANGILELLNRKV